MTWIVQEEQNDAGYISLCLLLYNFALSMLALPSVLLPQQSLLRQFLLVKCTQLPVVLLACSKLSCVMQTALRAIVSSIAHDDSLVTEVREAFEELEHGHAGSVKNSVLLQVFPLTCRCSISC